MYHTIYTMSSFWFLFVIIIQCKAKFRPKIIGGYKALPAEFPFVVSLEYKNTNKHFCGGSLVRLSHVLSSAHCFHDNPHLILKPNSVVAVCGDVIIGRTKSPMRQIIESKNIVVHKQFSMKNYEHDIAIVVLKTSFEATKFVAVGEMSEGRPSLKEICIAIGWGVTSENSIENSAFLMAANITVTEDHNCNKKEFTMSFHNETQICASDYNWMADACKGDSGGPFVCNGKITGLVSYGFGCARRGFPGIYTYVPYYKNWIEKVIEETRVLKYTSKQTWSSS